MQGYADDLNDPDHADFAKFAEETEVSQWLAKALESTENKELQTEEVKDTLRYTLREVGLEMFSITLLII